jgi:type I restriction enzyme S subunit
MSNNSKVPQIRFKGFTEDWEQRKLGELGEFTSNGVDKLSKVDEIPVNLLNYMDVYNRRKITSKNCSDLMHVTAKSTQVKNNNVQAGDVFFTPTSETAEDIGHVLVIEENLTNTVYSYHLMRYRPHKNIFFKTYPNYGFDTNELHTQMSIKAKGVQRFVISKPDFEGLLITYPKLNEQGKIASFLTNLDNLITLHQRKYDKLVNIKKALLERMFPQAGETVPAIRFKGFTDAWEQRKLGEFGKATGGTSIESEFTETGKYKVISIGSYSERSIYADQGIRADKTNKTESRILNKDDLTMILNDKTTAGNIIGRVLLIDDDNTYVYNQRTERIEVNKNEYEPHFLYHFLNVDNIRTKIIRASQGNTQIYVNWSAISELQYSVPLSKSEQRQIGAFIGKLDNLITLHQRKLEKLKNIKSALLEKMFVS